MQDRQKKEEQNEDFKRKIDNHFKKLLKEIPDLAYAKPANKDLPYFIFWLIGFFNRKGSFSINAGRPVFSLEHKEDPELLNFISKSLKAGKIYQLNSIKKGKYYNSTKLSFKSQKDFSIIVAILNGFLFEEEKIQRFSKALEAYNLNTKQQIRLKKPDLSWFNTNLFFQAFFIGFLEAAQVPPFGYNYNARIFTIFPYISIFDSKNEKLLRVFKKIFKEKKKETVPAIEKGRNSQANQYQSSYKNSLFFEGFQSQAAATKTQTPSIDRVVHILNSNSFFGKKKESFQAFLSLNNEIKNLELFKKDKKKLQVFEYLMKKVILFLEEFKPAKIKKAIKSSNFYKKV